MLRHGFLSVMLITLLLLLGGIYLSSFKDPMANHVGFPWQVEVQPDGHTRVFQLTLGKTPLIEAEKQFKAIAELTLFSDQQGVHAVEAFFGDVTSAGLKAKMVMKIQLDQQQMQAMFDRGARISTLGSGTRKVTLSSEDAEMVRQLPIASLTYLPSIHLQPELVLKRFGEPTEKLQDPQSDAEHWLYPDKGVDIAISESRKEVIQYVLPKNFDTLVQPLKQTTSLDQAASTQQ